MFCKKCGAQLKENSKFCGVCGTPYEAAPVQQPMQQAPVQQPVQQAPVQQPVQQAPVQQPMQPVADPFGTPVQQPVADPFANQNQAGQFNAQAPKKKSKLPLILSLCGVGALLVTIIIVVICLIACSGGGAGSPQEACENFFEALNDKDYGDLVDTMYPVIVNMDEDFDLDINDKDEIIENIIEACNPGEEGETPVFSDVKVKKKEAISKSKIKEMNKEVKSEEGYINIENGCNVTGTVKIKVDGEKDTYSFSAQLVLADGDWYVCQLYVNTYSSIDED